MADHQELLPVAREAVAIARRIVRERAPVSVIAKGDRDLVTDVDLAVEEAVREFLTGETPEIGILGEEHGRTGPSDGLWWALDPVDGTANFARGIPLCGVSLGLVEARCAVLAAIDLPFLDVTYTAVEGHGAFACDERIHVSGATDLADAAIAIGDFAVGEGAEVKNRARLALLAALGARAQRIRMFGTAAVDLAWVAQGRLEATVILANLPWDTLAGVLLVREAGGFVLDGDGTGHTVDSAATIAVCPGLKAELMSIFGKPAV
ncbi:inositol monophosphatase family protein [Amycolatopsis alkalitolerans]|uniref:Inositol monophosphatase n=1 Tax=Amycolatopsis alkalitolerans TaxID=2547244 RepID=A0A5C4LW09_9PSEU|nr:inositol monophosphatase family protein [Amycolatopsis alkalitolerans]TNC23563.1 inositol monophosphatase [Amycolatopsis alkalitolerans]